MQGTEFASAYALGALGQIFMPFVEEPTPYIPAEGIKTDKGKSADPRKKKPSVIREEAENLNKQLREAAFNGTIGEPRRGVANSWALGTTATDWLPSDACARGLVAGTAHLPTEFAGIFKRCDEVIDHHERRGLPESSAACYSSH